MPRFRYWAMRETSDSAREGTVCEVWDEPGECGFISLIHTSIQSNRCYYYPCLTGEGIWGPERLSNLVEVTQLVGRAECGFEHRPSGSRACAYNHCIKLLLSMCKYAHLYVFLQTHNPLSMGAFWYGSVCGPMCLQPAWYVCLALWMSAQICAADCV